MSVLIKGMDMPCGEEALTIRIYPNGTVTSYPCMGFVKIADAVEVPKHGRLIDADKAAEAMLFEMCGTGYQSRAMDILQYDFYTPTVIESEE